MSYSHTVSNIPTAATTGTSPLKPVTQTAATPTVGEPAKGGNGASPAVDQTSLSQASTLLAVALQTSDVRTDKVAGLQQAIASGNYTISSADVADKLLQSLLGR